MFAHTVPGAVFCDANATPPTHRWNDEPHTESHTTPSCHGQSPVGVNGDGVGTDDGVDVMVTGVDVEVGVLVAEAGDGVAEIDGATGPAHAPAHNGLLCRMIALFKQPVPGAASCMPNDTPLQHCVNEAVQFETVTLSAVRFARSDTS